MRSSSVKLCYPRSSLCGLYVALSSFPQVPMFSPDASPNDLAAIRTFSGYKLQALEVEAALHGLPYVSTALVVGVEDQACHQRVAAVIGLRPHPSSITIDLSRLRKDLTRTALQWYKFPTAVYWLSPVSSPIPILPSAE